MKTGWKIAIVAALIAVVYFAVGIAAWLILPAKIADKERRLPGIELALAKLAGDQLAVSRRITEITAATLGRGGDKVDEVAMILADRELNLLALNYLGADWSLIRSQFQGDVKHMRTLIKIQREKRDKSITNSRLFKKVEELERRKKGLANLLRSPSTERSWQIEMDDIEDQLRDLRNSAEWRKYYEQREVEKQDVEAEAQTEVKIFTLAREYQDKTVGTLNRVIAEQKAALKKEADEPFHLRHRMSVFNIWPLNLLAKIPLEDAQ